MIAWLRFDAVRPRRFGRDLLVVGEAEQAFGEKFFVFEKYQPLRCHTGAAAEGPRHRERGLIRPAAGRKIAFWLFMLLLLSMTACGEKAVATVSTEAEAIEIIGVLRENGFEVEKREVGEGETKRWATVLDEGYFSNGDLALALQVLHDYGLPRPEELPVESSSLIPSETEQRIQEQRRLRADIERQLRALPGVTTAIVIVVMPPDDQVFQLQPQPASASAFIIYKDATPLFNLEQVRDMMAHSVPDLKPESVSIILSQQTPRPGPVRELSARRRGNILVAAGGGLIVVLFFMFVLLQMQIRRQRHAFAELQDRNGSHGSDEEESDTAGELPEPARPMLSSAIAQTTFYS
ncbi:MAG: hypothetical protein ABW250_13080 [Pyrinomonadaceae bacterium]